MHVTSLKQHECVLCFLASGILHLVVDLPASQVSVSSMLSQVSDYSPNAPQKTVFWKFEVCRVGDRLISSLMKRESLFQVLTALP